MQRLGVALIGTGAIAIANHLPGVSLCPDTAVVALCDSDAAVLERARAATGVTAVSTDHREILRRDDVHAVIIATPNDSHARLAIDAVRAGKHVLCEKPLGMDLAETVAMRDAAVAAGVRHMTAFTYRFVPAMRWMARLVADGAIGRPWHFRAQRFQDWDRRFLGWRQVRARAGTGEVGDMLSHRIDFGFLLAGPIARVVAQTRRLVPLRGGVESELDDWVGMLGEFSAGTTGAWESSKVVTGAGEGARSRDHCEVNGPDGTLIYAQSRPHEILRGRAGDRELARVAVPDEFLVWPGSGRDPRAGDPLQAFRWDQDVEFISAIREGRDCVPSFADGVRTQAVMDAAVRSAAERRWVEIAEDA